MNPKPAMPRVAGMPTGATGRRLGIRAHLFIAFGVVAALTVMASGVAFFSYNRIGDTLAAITGRNMPAMTLALTLARESAEITATAPTLAAAADTKARDAAMATVEAHLQRLGGAVGAIAAHPESATAAAELRKRLQDLAAGLKDLSSAVERRLAAQAEREALAKSVRAAHRALAEKLTPLVDDANFNLTLGLQSATDKKTDIGAVAKTLSALADTDLNQMQAFLQLQAETNLAQGLLTEASIAPSKEYLAPIKESFDAAAGRVGKALGQLKGTPAGEALKPLVAGILDYGSGDKSAFAVRLKELGERAASEKALDGNIALAKGLEQDVAGLVTRTEAEAKDAADGSNAEISRGRFLLISIAVASLAIAVGIAWLYAGRILARRLIALRASMRAIADGDFAADVPLSGHDEIADMAEA
jgi:HAMP domain-containing protein